MCDRYDDLTQLLQRWSQGDEEAGEEVFPLVYEELHRIASGFFAGERDDHTLQTTAVINEAYLNLCRGSRVRLRDRSHFYALMTRVMRRVLIDYARERGRAKRWGKAERIMLDETGLLGAERGPDLVALDDVLTELEQVDPEKAAIIELRFFGGFTIEETAAQLGISDTTVVRQWRRARAWLYHRLSIAAS